MRFAQKLWSSLFGPSRYETMTLGQLVKLVSTHPTKSNRNALYGRLLFSKVGARSSDPALIRLAGTHVTGKDFNESIPCGYGSDGNFYFFVFCEIPSMLAEFPTDHFYELDARVVLEMAASNGGGLIVQSRDESWITVPNEDIANILSGKHTNTLIVPVGHKIVTVTATPVSHLGCLEAGVWVAQLGYLEGIDQVISGVRLLVTQPHRKSVTWIFHPIVMESPVVFEMVVSALESMIREPAATIGHVIVAAYATERHLPQMRKLKSLGVAVHYSGPCGECLLEIHKPDGIVMAMPGRAFK